MKIVAADPGSYIDKFNFRSEICISCDWRRLELGPKVRMRCRPGHSCTTTPPVHTAMVRSRSHALLLSRVDIRKPVLESCLQALRHTLARLRDSMAR